MRKHPEFESLPLRFLIFTWCHLFWQVTLYVRRSTQVGRRGAPAKGVGRVTGARVQISPSPETKRQANACLFLFSGEIELERRLPARCVMSQEQNAIGQTEHMPTPQKKRVPLQREADLMRLTAEWTSAIIINNKSETMRDLFRYRHESLINYSDSVDFVPIMWYNINIC